MTESIRPRRRRPATRGLLFGAPLDRVAAPAPAIGGMVSLPRRRSTPVPIALVGESTPVAPVKVVAYGAMAAAWPLRDRSVDAGDEGANGCQADGTGGEADRRLLLGG